MACFDSPCVHTGEIRTWGNTHERKQMCHSRSVQHRCIGAHTWIFPGIYSDRDDQKSPPRHREYPLTKKGDQRTEIRSAHWPPLETCSYRHPPPQILPENLLTKKGDQRTETRSAHWPPIQNPAHQAHPTTGPQAPLPTGLPRTHPYHSTNDNREEGRSDRLRRQRGPSTRAAPYKLILLLLVYLYTLKRRPAFYLLVQKRSMHHSKRYEAKRRCSPSAETHQPSQRQSLSCGSQRLSPGALTEAKSPVDPLKMNS